MHCIVFTLQLHYITFHYITTVEFIIIQFYSTMGGYNAPDSVVKRILNPPSAVGFCVNYIPQSPAETSA